jgi:ceramide glucosyltransferase
MIHYAVRIFQVAAIIGCVSSSVYYLLCLWSAVAFLNGRKEEAERLSGSTPPDALPPVSILKPLKGIDPDIYESFRSHCLQDYPSYEIIFGVSDPQDPAIESVRQLQREFSERTIQLVVCREALGTNLKVSNLAQMLQAARHSHIIVNDSDIRVEPDYLRRVMNPFCDQQVGMVTCLYRGLPASTLGSRLEALGLSTEFCAGVLVAYVSALGRLSPFGAAILSALADLLRSSTSSPTTMSSGGASPAWGCRSGFPTSL